MYFNDIIGFNFQEYNHPDIHAALIDEPAQRHSIKEELRLVKGPDDPDRFKENGEEEDDHSDDESVTEVKKLLNVRGAEKVTRNSQESISSSFNSQYQNCRHVDKQFKCRVFYSEIMLVGHVNAGKTCLVDSLLDVPFNPVNRNGVDPLECTVCNIHVSTSTNSLKYERKDTPLHERFQEQLECEIADAILPDVDLSICTTVSNETTGLNVSGNSCSCSKVKDTRMSDMKIIDTSGEVMFYKSHKMLFSPSTVFLLVMDASRKLDEPLPQSLDTESGKFNCPKTPREYLDYWLTSITTFLSRNSDPLCDTGPSIIIVLTHTDLLEVQTRKGEVEADILDHVRSQHACKYIYPHVMSLSNRDRSELDMVSLKATILKLCQSKPTFGLEQPCLWLNFDAEIQKYCRRARKRYLTLQELQVNVAEKLQLLPKEVKKYLKFHSKFGNVVFLNDTTTESLIITDIQLLVDTFKAVWHLKDVKRMGFDLACQEDLKSGLENGLISQENLINALKNTNCAVTKEFKDLKHLVTILTRYGQFIPYEDPHGSQQFIVPGLLPPYDETKVSLGPFKPVQRAKPLVYLFHQSSEKRRVKASGFLPNDLLFLLVSSFGRTNIDGSYWELIKLFSNGAVFRAGMQDQFLVTIKSMAAVMILSIYFVGDLEYDTPDCEISTVRGMFEENVRYLLNSNYRNVLCSVCVSPCEGKDFQETLKQHKYHCPDILGRIGEVGHKRLKIAVCLEHNKNNSVDDYNCWFCNERRHQQNAGAERSPIKQQSLKDQKLLNRISREIEDFPMLRNIGLALDVGVEVINRRFSNSNSRIEDAAFNVLYCDWYGKKGYLIEGTDAFNELSNALSEAGLAKTLSQLLYSK